MEGKTLFKGRSSDVLNGSELDIGMVFNYKGKPHVITSGKYMGTHGISNHWYFRQILKTGKLSKVDKYDYCRNNDFTICPDKYEVIYVKKTA